MDNMNMNDIKYFIKTLREGQYIYEGNDIIGCKSPSRAELKAADVIEQLVKERDGWRMAYDGAKRAHHEWFAEAQKLMKDRDALKKKVEARCHICKHYNPSDWEWRGVQE